MAKRRKLEVPSAADLDQMEETFRRETSTSSAMAPIAQVASESAMNMDVVGTEQRKMNAELDRFRAADAQGLVAQKINVDDVDTTAITRDRMRLNPEAFEELKGSIRKNGLRMPIEVFETTGDGKTYGLISGFRRLRAVQELNQEAGQGAGQVEAFVRVRDDDARLTEAMVEENEIRSALSHYERARISVLSVQNGLDQNLDAAANRLFEFASKAKRSKIRSFAVIYEALGDVLRFGDKLKEKQGLVLSAALKGGAANDLRAALGQTQIESAAEEWGVISKVIAPEKASASGSKSEQNQFVTNGGAPVKLTNTARGLSVQIGGALTAAQTAKLVAFLKGLG